MMPKLLQNHFIAFVSAILLSGVAIFIISIFPRSPLEKELIEVVGKQQKHSGKYSNFIKSEQSEIDLIASIKNKNQLTLFGSSEFLRSPYSSYNFLPDSLGIPTLGIGHAFHQDLSILMELLACNDVLEGSKICVFLSPGWFESEGTNVQAFVEFARPNFLNKILHDEDIPVKYKIHIGRYIHENYKQIEGVSISMDGLRNLYVEEQGSIWNKKRFQLKKQLVPNRKEINTEYHVNIEESQIKVHEGFEFTAAKNRVQKEFVAGIESNSMFVSDHYFESYLDKGNGEFDKGNMKPIDLSKSNEFDDLKFVLELLSEKKVKASFVMQTLNPIYYNGVKENQVAILNIVKEIENHGFPCLNMYVSEESDFVPGTLKDIMHLGDFGWMNVNEFIFETYYE